MPRTEDGDAVEIVLDDGQSVSGQRTDGWLEFETSNSDTVQIHIDDGSTGGTPAQYTMTVHCYKPQHNDWMFDQQATSQTANTQTIDASNQRMRIDIENTSTNNGQTYRITAEAIRSP